MANNQPDVRIRLSAEGVQEVVNALKQIQQQAQTTADAAEDTSAGFNQAAQGMQMLRTAALGVGAALAGLAILDKVYGTVKDFYALGLEKNGIAENSRIALAAVLASQAQLTDGNGKLLTGQQAYAGAIQLSQAYMDGLADKAANTALSVGTLQSASRGLVFTALSSGITDMEGLQQLTVDAANAMQLLGLEVDDLEEQLGAMLRGEGGDLADRLKLEGEDLQKWAEQGTLIDELRKRLEDFALANEEYGKSWEGVQKRAENALGSISKQASSGMFEKLRTGFSDALSGLFAKTGELSPALTPVVELASRFGNYLGEAGSAVANGVVNGLKSAGAWLKQNSNLVNGLATGFSGVIGFVGRIVDLLGFAFNVLGGMKTVTFVVSGALNGAVIVANSFYLMLVSVAMAATKVGQIIAAAAANLGILSRGVEQSFTKALDGLAASANKAQAAIRGAAKASAETVFGNGYGSVGGDTAKGKGAATVGGMPTISKSKFAGAGGAGDGGAAAEAAAKARYALLVAKADQEAALLKAQNALAEQLEKARYDKGLVSLADYQEKKLAALKAEQAAELRVLDARLKAAQAQPAKDEAGRLARTQAIAEAESAIKTKKLANEQALAAFETSAAEERLRLGEQKIALDRRIMEADGQVRDVALAALDDEIKKADELLRKQGVLAAEREATLAKLRAQGEAKIGLEDLARQGKGVFDDLSVAQAGLNNQVENGSLFEFQAQQQLTTLYAQRIPQLQAIAAEMKRIAEASNNPEMLRQAAEFGNQVDSLQNKTNDWGQSLATLKETGFNAATQGFQTFLTDVANGSQSISGAFRSMAASIVGALQQVLAQMIAVKVMQAAMSAMGVPMPGFATGGQVGTGVGAIKKATGGYIAGPGTGTSDSIPAWLSNGEFVVRAAVVQQPGVLSMLSALNRGQLRPSLNSHDALGVRKYADGGLVGAMQPASGGDSSMTVGLEPGLVLKELNTPAGRRVLVEMLGRERRSVRNVLG